MRPDDADDDEPVAPVATRRPISDLAVQLGDACVDLTSDSMGATYSLRGEALIKYADDGKVAPG
eukprot:2625847-Alexandrium_andersonii.AAC.1